MARRGEDLYEKHARSVYRYLFSLSGEPDTAEDRLWYKELEHRSRTAPLEEEHLSSLTAPDNPEGEAERREDRMALYRSLRQLDPETREVIYLRLAGEFSFREVGELMGQSEVWARVRFYRGKEKLAKLLTGGRPNG